MTLTFRTAVAALAAMTVLGSAGAGQAASHNRDTFIRQQDEDRDGKVSKDEFAAGRQKEFARQDANRDGGLSRDEYVNDFKARLEAMLAKVPAAERDAQRTRELQQVEVRFGILDSDKSGKITPAEFAYSGWMMFAVHDSNKDGFVSKDEAVPKRGN